MRQKIKTTVNILFIVAFLVMLAAFAFLNAGKLEELLKSADKSLDGWQESASSVEASMKEKVKGRNKLIDLYGLSLMALDRDLVGDFEFVKDDAGIIQRFEPRFNADKYLADIQKLKAVTDEKDIALVHAILPNKAKNLSEITDELMLTGTQSYVIKENLEAEGIDCLDFDSLLNEGGDAPPFEEFYFKTDVHDTTRAEFWMARELARYLSEQYEIEFPKADEVFDLANYTVKAYDFIGNTARSSGRYFSGIDKFEIYRPTFETDLTLSVPFSGLSRSGDFEAVMLNGYEDRSNISEYTYWVIDFGQYPSPYYQYVNLNMDEDAPKLLLLTDSSLMRGLSYLALTCREVTVLDPRSFGGTDYLAYELQFEDYDAVAIIGSGNAFFSSDPVPSVDLPDLPQATMITREEYGGWVANQGICLDAYNDIRLEGSTIPVDHAATTVKLRGWAADFCNDAPFKELYLQVGDVLMRCDYNIERTSVVDHFHKDSLLKTGFEITFPASYLKDGQVREISFIGVSADGQYLYEPVTYQLQY